MIRRFLQQKRKVAALCVGMLALGMWTSAFAQLDYDTYDIYQTAVGAEPTLVGTIYVPQRAAGQEVYAEYWVLFPGYTYPSEKTPITTEIVPSTGYRYTSIEDFLANVPWVEGSRFVTIVALDTTVLPGRTPSTANIR